MNKKEKKNSFKTIDIAYVGVAAALIAICSWISIPLPSGVPVTLQTMGICLVCTILGFKKGTISTIVYILIGLMGVPVFSGFTAGPSRLFGQTGGYIIGFIFTAAAVGAVADYIDKKSFKLPVKYIAIFLSMIIGIILCYAFGTAWFAYLYAKSNEAASLGTILGWCVVPYIIPDIVKIAVATLISVPIRKAINKI